MAAAILGLAALATNLRRHEILESADRSKQILSIHIWVCGLLSRTTVLLSFLKYLLQQTLQQPSMACSLATQTAFAPTLSHYGKLIDVMFPFELWYHHVPWFLVDYRVNREALCSVAQCVCDPSLVMCLSLLLSKALLKTNFPL